MPQGDYLDETGQAFQLPVSAQAADVPNVGALTSTNAAGANPTQAEFNALRADVTTLRTTLNNLLTALRGAGKPMA